MRTTACSIVAMVCGLCASGGYSVGLSCHFLLACGWCFLFGSYQELGGGHKILYLPQIRHQNSAEQIFQNSFSLFADIVHRFKKKQDKWACFVG
jgi:hypothetical protein